jgi:hypothetical protein
MFHHASQYVIMVRHTSSCFIVVHHSPQCFIMCHHISSCSGWWYIYPSEKYEFVSWDNNSPNMWKNKCSKPSTSVSWYLIMFHHKRILLLEISPFDSLDLLRALVILHLMLINQGHGQSVTVNEILRSWSFDCSNIMDVYCIFFHCSCLHSRVLKQWILLVAY